MVPSAGTVFHDLVKPIRSMITNEPKNGVNISNRIVTFEKTTSIFHWTMIVGAWICLLVVWKKFQKYSAKWWFDGHESDGRIRKKKYQPKQIPETFHEAKKTLRMGLFPFFRGWFHNPFLEPRDGRIVLVNVSRLKKCSKSYWLMRIVIVGMLYFPFPKEPGNISTPHYKPKQPMLW